jgi:hypothetical protein
VISLAVAAADWVGLVHPEITPSSNFHHLRDTTQIDPLAAVNLRLTIQRQIACVLPENHISLLSQPSPENS